MNRISVRKAVSLVTVLVWMAVIFSFSAQKAEASSEVSGSLTSHLLTEVCQTFSLDWDEDTLVKYAQKLEHPIRKAAHMTEYAILACLICNCLYQYGCRRRYFLRAELLTACYAASDEIHQLFVPGRSGQISDVCIDAAGAGIGLLILYGIISMIRHLLIKKNMHGISGTEKFHV